MYNHCFSKLRIRQFEDVNKVHGNHCGNNTVEDVLNSQDSNLPMLPEGVNGMNLDAAWGSVLGSQ